MTRAISRFGGAVPAPESDLVLVLALSHLRADGIVRRQGDEFLLARSMAQHLSSTTPPLTRMIGDPSKRLDWHDTRGRMLRATHDTAPYPWRVVACVNIWNDVPALMLTLPTWIDHVDRVVVIDGTYSAVPGLPVHSTDSLADYLRQVERRYKKPVELVRIETAWPNQAAKRSRFFDLAWPDELLFIVDADERVADSKLLRWVPWLDVGWVTMQSPVYARPYSQPRLIRNQPDLAYRGRHHWIYRGGELLTSHQYGGLALHALTSVTMRNIRGLGQDTIRAGLKRQIQTAQRGHENPTIATDWSATSDLSLSGREALRVLQLTHYDPGLVAYRLHTAINATTPHVSLLASSGGPDRNPFGALRQFDPEADRLTLLQAMASADVVHCHLDHGIVNALRKVGAKMPRHVVTHHHGSIFRKMAPALNRADRELAALRLISNFELMQYGENLHWLPNPVPVVEYRRLRARTYAGPGDTFRVAHSPSKREYKGTEDFLDACESLRARGVPIQPVLIERLEHRAALELKASCDACFDSFWLGIQCSGIEAGAMQMPVIAGDPFVAAQYRAQLGGVPYLYANDRATLEDQLYNLATNESARHEAAKAVSDYVATFHDEAAVALRYLDLLDDAFGWRDAQRIERGTFPPAIIVANG